jgi:hypothetical protein
MWRHATAQRGVHRHWFNVIAAECRSLSPHTSFYQDQAWDSSHHGNNIRRCICSLVQNTGLFVPDNGQSTTVPCCCTPLAHPTLHTGQHHSSTDIHYKATLSSSRSSCDSSTGHCQSISYLAHCWYRCCRLVPLELDALGDPEGLLRTS